MQRWTLRQIEGLLHDPHVRALFGEELVIVATCDRASQLMATGHGSHRLGDGEGTSSAGASLTDVDWSG
jgi:hypothetical protein